MKFKTNQSIIKITVPTPFAIGDVNTYLIAGDRLTLIDAGVNTPEAKAVFEVEIKKAGYQVHDIEQVILTHHHPDHTGFLDNLDVDIYGHEYCKNWLTYNKPFMDWRKKFFHSLFIEFGVPKEMIELSNNLEKTLQYGSQKSELTGFLKEGDELPALPGWQVIETPGHAQSHLAFYQEKTGILLAGDHLLKTVSSNPLIEPPMQEGNKRARSLLQYHHSLKKLMNINIELALTGHGNNIKAVNPLIERRFERQHERAMLVLSMLQKTPMTVFDVCVLLFPEAYKQETGFTLSETVGQFDYLVERGHIKIDRVENGAVYYRG